MSKTNYYNEYKKSELYNTISSSDFTEHEYNELKQELESTYNTISDDSEQSSEYELVNGAAAMLRYAIKHLCRVYPTYGINNYLVLGVSHDSDSETVVKEVDATHEEQAKFYFHTHYNHKQYKVVSVTKL